MAGIHVLQIAKYCADPEVPAAVMFSSSAGGLGALAVHSHAFFELVYVRGGGGINVIEGRPYPMVQGDLLVMQPGDAHRYQSDPDGEIRLVNVLFTPALWPPATWQALLALRGLAPLLGPRPSGQAHKLALAPDDARQALALCRRLQQESEAHQDDWPLVAPTLITEILLLIGRANAAYGSLPAHAQAPGDPIALAMARMHEDPTREVTVAQLAGAAGLSTAWFGERFKRETGLSVRAFLTRLRLEEARRLLEEGASITDAALAVGFRDPSYFARVFRRFAQLSPRDYRRLGRSG